MAVSREVSDLLEQLERELQQRVNDDTRYDAYYEGSHRLERLGLAVPPEMEKLETVVNWCRTTVDSVSDRLQMRRFYMPGEDQASDDLLEQWDYNNLDSEAVLNHQETMILGRGFVSVGANEADPEFPLIRVESPREIVARVNRRWRRIDVAARFEPGEDDLDPTAQFATLYEPNSTTWFERVRGQWTEIDKDEHGLGVVPLVMFLNRRRVGRWDGSSEMKDVISLTDAACRSLTNLQLAGETHSVPQKYVLGMTKGDFVDKAGNPIPAWEAYFNSIWANANKDAKVGQFAASDLKNFHDTVNHYAQQVAGITGLPARYFGQTSVNPAAEGAIRADESRLILNAERKQAMFGDSWGWVMALSLRFRTGDWVQGSRIKTEWYDAGTPTRAQTADAMSKLYANGQGILSREGVWDELGWSEARKDRERGYLESEARITLTALEKDVAEEV
ncbi:hypothetical protein GCM10022377_10110 [Zhihengliuella alba]|uniref:Phage portal protein n=1 Tax=Zhihengliuella alba TaxID=547018 RepID=A0ABP7D3G9_9MICC